MIDSQIVEYMENGGKLFSPISLHEVRDGTHYFFKCSGGNEFFINHISLKFFDKDRNLIEDDLFIQYLKDRLKTYLIRKEEELIRHKNFINKFNENRTNFD